MVHEKEESHPWMVLKEGGEVLILSSELGSVMWGGFSPLSSPGVPAGGGVWGPLPTEAALLYIGGWQRL